MAAVSAEVRSFSPGFPAVWASSRLPQGGIAVCVGMPGRKGNTIGDSVQSPVAGLPAARCARNPVGEQASERRSRAITSGVGRLKLLVERHLATPVD